MGKMFIVIAAVGILVVLWFIYRWVICGLFSKLCWHRWETPFPGMPTYCKYCLKDQDETAFDRWLGFKK